MSAAAAEKLEIGEGVKIRSDWKLRKFRGGVDIVERFRQGDKSPECQPFEVIDVAGNLLLNEGKAELHDLLTGAAATHFGNANARLAVGDSSTAAAATQTDLQAATNKYYQAVDGGSPTYSAGVSTWIVTVADGNAEFEWLEVSLANGASGAADNLNRKVVSLGTKVAGQTWELTFTITWS